MNGSAPGPTKTAPVEYGRCEDPPGVSAGAVENPGSRRWRPGSPGG